MIRHQRRNARTNVYYLQKKRFKSSKNICSLPLIRLPLLLLQLVLLRLPPRHLNKVSPQAVVEVVLPLLLRDLFHQVVLTLSLIVMTVVPALLKAPRMMLQLVLLRELLLRLLLSTLHQCLLGQAIA